MGIDRSRRAVVPFAATDGTRIENGCLFPCFIHVPSAALEKYVLLFVLGISVAFRAAPAIALDRADQVPDSLRNVGIAERLNAQVSLDLKFVDSNGESVTLGQFFDGKLPVLLTMNYSNCPRLCSLQINGLVQGMEGLDWNLGDKFRAITVSIDPNESPGRAGQTKKRYLEDYGRPGAEEGWRFLTGREEEIRRLADSVGFRYRYIEEDRIYAHEAVTIVCSPKGRVSRYLRGIEYKPETLRLALVEAGEGKVGTTVDQIVLLCASYDAESGSYAAAAMKIMRLGSGLFVAVLGAVLTLFWLRGSKRARVLAKGREPTTDNRQLTTDNRLA